MTEFGKWLGISDGREMIAAVCSQYQCTEEQARAVITTYCMLFGVEVDTKHWDDLMHWTYHNYNSWFDTFEKFDAFMCGLLI